MRISELRQAVLRMGALSKRHGATGEAKALEELARVTEPYDDKTVTQFVALAKPRKAKKK